MKVKFLNIFVIVTAERNLTKYYKIDRFKIYSVNVKHGNTNRNVTLIFSSNRLYYVVLSYNKYLYPTIVLESFKYGSRRIKELRM